MPEPLEVTCPGCRCRLLVDRRTGKVIETRKPLEELQDGEDRFDALVRKARGRGDEALDKFSKAQERQKDKLARLDSLFKETKERVEESGDIGPETREIDLD